MMTTQGQTVRISMKDLRVMGRATQGVKLVQLREKDKLWAIEKLVGVEEAPDAEVAVNGSEQTL
jgi:DNA gyrase subunit A